MPITRREIDTFDADAVNREKTHALQRTTLRRKARAHGLELRHSAYGYALIDANRAHLDGRNDLGLDEVAVRLANLSSARPDPHANRPSGRG
jgi:hypothetical protein